VYRRDDDWGYGYGPENEGRETWTGAWERPWQYGWQGYGGSEPWRGSAGYTGSWGGWGNQGYRGYGPGWQNRPWYGGQGYGGWGGPGTGQGWPGYGRSGMGWGQEYGGYGETGGEPYTAPAPAGMGYDWASTWAGTRRGQGGWMEGPHTGRGPRNSYRSDERIRDDACDRLTRHGGIDASDIEVDVAQGEVTLRGTVDSRAQKRMAEDVVESVPGVRDVHNQLRVQQQGEARQGMQAQPATQPASAAQRTTANQHTRTT
jgi:hypothetical protein